MPPWRSKVEANPIATGQPLGWLAAARWRGGVEDVNTFARLGVNPLPLGAGRPHGRGAGAARDPARGRGGVHGRRAALARGGLAAGAAAPLRHHAHDAPVPLRTVARRADPRL